MYTLFENHLIRLPPSDLRPLLKSLILSLLPALEEETSEDFERAFHILENLEQIFLPNDEVKADSDRDGYFWQCLFLCVITSPSRRQGALNFLVQRLPRLSLNSREGHNRNSSNANGSLTTLSAAAEAVISPEPGLLIRCFACGLSDSQVLIQRGFLDLLVTNLPLDSPLLQSRIRSDDLDRLVSATVQVLLRREMSLNRRLWSWFLGPDLKANPSDSQPPSPIMQRKEFVDVDANVQFKYFSTYGRKPLERCVLAMFKRSTTNALERARPFRICLSLMDRWEIGGLIVPNIFLPAVESVYDYGLSASANDTNEVMRSASLFFDGVEASLIWSNLLKLLRNGLTPVDDRDNLQLFSWIVRRFNINDEEMLTVHIPHATIYLLSIIGDSRLSTISVTRRDALLDAASTLLDMIPERGFVSSAEEASQASRSSSDILRGRNFRKDIDDFYQAKEQPTNSDAPFGGQNTAETLYYLVELLIRRALGHALEEAFNRAVSLLLTLHSKVPSSIALGQSNVTSGIFQALDAATNEERPLTFPTINSMILLVNALSSTPHQGSVIAKTDIVALEPAITAQVWRYLSPSFPKYNVEAVKAIWQIQDLVFSEDCLEASLTALTREGFGSNPSSENTRAETVYRFATLWNHTIPAPSSPKPNSKGSTRRGSTIPSVFDTKHASYRQQILTNSLMLTLDLLNNPADIAIDAVKSWLHGLASLEQIFRILFDLMNQLMKTEDSLTSHSDKFVLRDSDDKLRSLGYLVEHFLNILRHGNGWVWQCLGDMSSLTLDDSDEMSGIEVLAECSIRFLCNEQYSLPALERKSIELLDILSTGPLAVRLRILDLDSRLIDYLMASLYAAKVDLQSSLLEIIDKALKLRLILDTPVSNADHRSSGPTSAQGQSVTGIRPIPNASNTSLAVTPPPQLLNFLRAGFSASAARPYLHQWLAFLSSILPVFADAIFASVIPLVECFCAELDKEHSNLVSISKQGDAPTTAAPESTTMALLEALDMVLARAHECLTDEHSAETVKVPPPSRNLLGNVASGVFKSEGHPSRTAHANSRLTVILTFQDAIRVCVKLWIWASHTTELEDFDKNSAATTVYSAQRIRHRTRHLLEQIFSSEPLESLEVVIFNWCYTVDPKQASASLDLLHVMKGLRPKNVVPTILDALCSRTNSAVLPVPRQSSQAIELTAIDVALFHSAYLQSIEDDAMDEIWSDCLAFLRDVLSNPLPYRSILPCLLSIILLLAQKADNTNFGEPRKMRRDLGDLFLRVLAATFTTMPSGHVFEIEAVEAQLVNDEVSNSAVGRKATSLIGVLKEITADLDVVLETSDRTVTAINSISSHLIAPLFHAKAFPENITSNALALLLQISKKAPSAKSWKKELLDAFNDPKLLTVSITQMENDWFPVLYQWCLHDQERMPELLSRLAPPSSAGIMFGVGANAARLEADRRTQLNLRRMCIVLLSSPEDTFATHLRAVEEKLTLLFDASTSSSPSAATKAEIFMLCRAVALSTSAVHLAPIWPIINDNLQSALTSLLPNASNSNAFSNLTLLQACKLLDLLVALSPDEFQLHEWLYITDTIDAVYQSSDWSPTALSDQIAEALASDSRDDSIGMIPPTPIASGMSGRRRPLLDNGAILDKEDLKATTREDFARAVIRPFVSQLSIHAYEGVYSMDAPDIKVCRRNLLEDLLDLTTIVE